MIRIPFQDSRNYVGRVPRTTTIGAWCAPYNFAIDSIMKRVP